MLYPQFAQVTSEFPFICRHGLTTPFHEAIFALYANAVEQRERGLIFMGLTNRQRQVERASLSASGQVNFGIITAVRATQQ